MTEGPNEDSIEVAKITITKYFDERAQGGAACHIEYSEGLSLIDALGMISWVDKFVVDDYTSKNDEE